MTHPSKRKKNITAYAKYTGLGFQLAGIVFFSLFIGQWLDKKIPIEIPIITIGLLLLSVGAFFYKLIKELS